MIIACCVEKPDSGSPLDSRFGRANWFAIIEEDSGNVREFVKNAAKDEPSGAGSMAVQILSSHGVEAIISPDVGPKAHQALRLCRIRAFNQGSLASIPEALSAWKAGELPEILAPQHKGLHRA